MMTITSLRTLHNLTGKRAPVSMRCTRNLVCPVWLGPILKHNSVPAPLLVRRLTSESCKKLAKERTSASVLREEKTWIQRFLGPKPMPPRRTLAWYKEVLLICTVFAITGSSTMVLVRPAVRDILGLEGSMKDGPWSYRICSLIVMSPIYGVLLVCVGTLFGRHFYFRYFAVKIFSRFGIPPEMLDKQFHETSKHFKRW